jgi:TrkA domain protein
MEINETPLPGVGLRYDFTTRSGRQIGVISHRSGRRDLVVYDRDDPDTCQEVLRLSEEEAEGLAETLGGFRIAGSLAALQQQVEGVGIDWLEIGAGSSFDRRTIADTQARTRTGVSIVAVLREGSTIPSPRPDFAFQAGDNVVVVGTPAGIRALTELLGS